MQLPPAQLQAHLAKGLRPLYTLHGDDPLLVQEAADAIRHAARASGYTERVTHVVSGQHFDWSVVLAASASLSLFADRQLLEIRMPTGKPGKEGSAALQHLAENATEDTLILVVLPRLDKATKTSGWFAALEGHGVCIPIEPIERSHLPHWLAQRLMRQNQRVKPGEEGERTLRFFADRIEGNLLAAHQEIQKLGLLYPEGELTLEQVQQAVAHVARYDVFKLTEAALAGQSARVVQMLDGLQAEGQAPVLVHYTLAEDIRALYKVKMMLQGGRALPVALREQRVWGVKERLFERVLSRLLEEDIHRLLLSAHRVDGIVKGLRDPEWPTEPWQALRRLGLDLAQVCKM